MRTRPIHWRRQRPRTYYRSLKCGLLGPWTPKSFLRAVLWWIVIAAIFLTAKKLLP